LTPERRDCALNAFYRAGVRAVIADSDSADGPGGAPAPAHFSLIQIPVRPPCAGAPEGATPVPR
jgi:hypothetical protein